MTGTPQPSAGAAPLVQAGLDALRRRDPARALGFFTQATADDGRSASAWLGLAYAHRDLGDGAAERAALDRALALQPANLRALLLKGDSFARDGDSRTASAFYASALRAAPPADRLSPELKAELARAQSAVARSAQDYEAHLRDHLAAAGLGAGSSGRFARGLDIMTGRARIHLQQPLFFYFPELPQRAFYERAEFPWLEAVEAETGAIRDELRVLMAGEEAFTPYVQAPADRPVNDRYGLVNNPSWSALHLWRNGAPVPETADRCPRAMAVLEHAPRAFIEGRTPIALFSRMTSGAHIPPHHGFVNTRLICHLPLLVPEGCELRVGGEYRRWREGETLIFDDTIEHEAWNRGDGVRVVLLFDIWRPELSEEERALVTAAFNAVDAYGGERVAWEG